MELLNTISTSRTWNRHGIKIAYAVAVLALLLVIASIVWNVYEQNRQRKIDFAEQTIAPIVKQTKQAYRVSDVMRANLFGDSTPKPVVQVAKETTLDLTLQGILSASDEQMARAIIMSGKRKSKLYSIGEDIQGAGVSVKEIRANEVLLNRNGAVESLPLKTRKGKGNSSIISYTSGSSGTLSAPGLQTTAAEEFDNISRSTPKSRSENGAPRKIRKPNFSGLDRALQKMGEI